MTELELDAAADYVRSIVSPLAPRDVLSYEDWSDDADQ